MLFIFPHNIIPVLFESYLNFSLPREQSSTLSPFTKPSLCVIM